MAAQRAGTADRSADERAGTGAPGARRVRVDAHAHVYDTHRFPFDATRGFDAQPNEHGTAAQFACVLDAHGFTHGLLVNPLGGYGVDNRCLLDELEQAGGRFRGVALVAHGTPEAEFERMRAAGVIGLRFNLDFPSSPSPFDPAAARTMAIAAELGWFAQIHYHVSASLPAALPVLQASGLPLVIDHCGRPDLGAGLADPGFQALLALGRDGRSAVKLSGVFRFSRTGFPYTDVDAHVAALWEAFGPDRCVWGSDWPFLRARERVDHACLLAALRRWLPSADDQDRVLTRNPARLFGFPSTLPEENPA